MNRHRWLYDNALEAMIQHVHDRQRPRRMRLFLAACLRRIIEHMQADLPGAARYLSSVEMLEQLADGQSKALVLGLHRASLEAGPLALAINAALLDPLTLEQVRLSLAYLVASVEAHLPIEAPSVACGYLRDIFGDPFAPVEISPQWRTSEVREMARGIYDERAFDRMPILADALLDAGCEDERVLGHCRAAVHLRGCWLVDGLLGKN